MIKIDNLSFGYNKNRMDLYNIDLNIKSGECVLLCGESGIIWIVYRNFTYCGVYNLGKVKTSCSR